jgi:hypothetical protein
MALARLVLMHAVASLASLNLGAKRSGKRHDQFFNTVAVFDVGNARRIEHTSNKLNTRRSLADGSNEHERAPVFELKGFNRAFVLDLRRNDFLFHPDYEEVRIHPSGRRTVRGRENCYYHGNVRGESGSHVAADTCGSGGIAGLQGMLTLGGGESFAFLPAHNHFNVPFANSSSANVPHLMYRKNDLDASKYNFGALQPASQLKRMDLPSEELGRRKNRRLQEKEAHFFEWGIVNDDGMFDMFGQDTESHTASMANSVAAAFAYKDPANFEDQTVVIHLKSQVTFVDAATFAASIDVSTHAASSILPSFAAWRKENFVDNDGAALLTTIDFDGGTIGLGYVGVVCSVSYSAGINQYVNDMITVSTMAHELGHIFGMRYSPTGSFLTPVHFSPSSSLPS